MTIAAVLALVLGLAWSSPAGANTASRGYDASYRHCRTDVGSVPTADCTTVAKTDAGRREIRFLSSVVTPAFGIAPGWGDAATNSVLTLRSAIRAETRKAAFAVRLRVGPLRVVEPLMSGHSRLAMRVHARHLGCSACRVHGIRLGGRTTRYVDDSTYVITFRDRERKDAVMPAGPVEIMIEARTSAAMYPPYAGAVLIPPAVPIPIVGVPMPGEASAGGTLKVLGVEAL